MKQLKNELLLAVGMISMALTVGACSKGNSSSNNDSGGVGSDILLIPSDTGFLDGSNEAGVLGPWYAYGDGYADGSSVYGTPPGKCQAAAHTDCSQFETPTPAMPFPPDSSGAMCAKGHAAVVADGANGPDYSNIFGAAIALDLNNAGTDDGGTGLKGSYDPTAHTPVITGVSFDIDNPPPNAFRVELPTNASAGGAMGGGTDNDAAWWGGATLNASPVKRGHNVFKWSEVGGPLYLITPTNNPPPFDVTKLTSIKFHVVTNATAAVEFNFCISNLALTTN